MMKSKLKFLILALCSSALISSATASLDQEQSGKGKGKAQALRDEIEGEKGKEKVATKKASCAPKYIIHDQWETIMNPRESEMIWTERPTKEQKFPDGRTGYLSPPINRLKALVFVDIEGKFMPVLCSPQSKEVNNNLREELTIANQLNCKLIGIRCAGPTPLEVHTLTSHFDAAVVAGYRIWAYPRMHNQDGTIIKEDANFIEYVKSLDPEEESNFFVPLFGGNPYYLKFATNKTDLPNIEVPVKKQAQERSLLAPEKSKKSGKKADSKSEKKLSPPAPAGDDFETDSEDEKAVYESVRGIDGMKKRMEKEGFKKKVVPPRSPREKVNEYEIDEKESTASIQSVTAEPIAKLMHPTLKKIFEDGRLVMEDGAIYDVDITDKEKKDTITDLLRKSNNYVARFVGVTDDKPSQNTLGNEGFAKAVWSYKLQKTRTFRKDSDVKAPKSANIEEPDVFHLFDMKVYQPKSDNIKRD